MTATAAPPLHHPHQPGSIRAALAYRDYRLVWMGMFASNIGTWMQNVALPAYIQARYDSATFVALSVFAQLGPLLLLSIPGGVVASRVRRKPLLIASQSVQLVGALVLAWMVSRNAGIAPIITANFAIGIANAFGAPAFQASIPAMVDRRDLPGSVALNSVQLNATRVIGPVIAALLLAAGFTTSQLFVVNAFTYLFVIAAFAVVTLPPPRGGGAPGWRALGEGWRIARGRRAVGRLLVSMTTFSFFSLAYVGLFATVAERAFSIKADSGTYKWLYAIWGLGAFAGAISSGTVFAKLDKRSLLRPGYIGFGVSLTAFALVRSATPAFAVGFVLGFFYFLTATAMITVFQQNISDAERPFVMSLWFMAFGGTVPLGNIAFGPLMDVIGPRPILLGGAVVAVLLSRYCDLRLLPASDFLQERGHAL